MNNNASQHQHKSLTTQFKFLKASVMSFTYGKNIIGKSNWITTLWNSISYVNIIG